MARTRRTNQQNPSPVSSILALHIGRTGTEAAIVDVSASPWQVTEHRARLEPQGQDQDAIIQLARQCAASILKTYRGEIAGTAISTPGQVHSSTGMVLTVPGLPWSNVELPHVFSSLPRPLFVDNDARACALAELLQGQGSGASDFVAVHLCTGLGAGFVLGGRLYRGYREISGEFGHQTIDWTQQARPCRCGNRGCLEAYASGWSLEEKIRSFPGAAAVGGKKLDYAKLTHREIRAAADAGDRLCQDLLAELGRFLGIGIANLLNVVGPEKIIIGGSLSPAWRHFEKAMRKEVLGRALPEAQSGVPIVQTQLGPDRDLLAAAAVYVYARRKQAGAADGGG